jgi:hypothetical protein
MRPTLLLTALASLSAVHAAAIANPAPAPAPEPAGELIPISLPGLGGGVTGITGVVGRLDSIGGLLNPLTATGGLLGGILPTVSALLDSLAGFLALPSTLIASVAPISGVTGALPLLGSIAPGSVGGADANKLIVSVRSVLLIHTRILNSLFERIKILNGVPILGPLLYSALMTIKGALDALIAAVIVVLDPAARDSLNETVVPFNALFGRVLTAFAPSGSGFL